MNLLSGGNAKCKKNTKSKKKTYKTWNETLNLMYNKTIIQLRRRYILCLKNLKFEIS